MSSEQRFMHSNSVKLYIAAFQNRTIAIRPFHISAFFFNPNGDVPSLKFKIVLSLLVAVIDFVNVSTDLACRYAIGFDLIADMTLLCGGAETDISRDGHPAGGSAKNRPINAMIVTANTLNDITLMISPSLNPCMTLLP